MYMYMYIYMYIYTYIYIYILEPRARFARAQVRSLANLHRTAAVVVVLTWLRMPRCVFGDPFRHLRSCALWRVGDVPKMLHSLSEASIVARSPSSRNEKLVVDAVWGVCHFKYVVRPVVANPFRLRPQGCEDGGGSLRELPLCPPPPPEGLTTPRGLLRPPAGPKSAQKDSRGP